MNEYQGYNVNELLEMTSLDNADALDEIGTGWANTAAVLGELHEALTERMQAIQGKWTSASSGPFLLRVTEAMSYVERAKVQADKRAEAVGKVAATARWARENVQTQHKEYLKATLKSTSEQIADTGNPWPGVMGTADDRPTESEIRRPFDEQARKYMKIAAEEYVGNKPAIDSEVRHVTPIYVPGGDWSDGQDSWAGDGGSGSNTSDMAGLSTVSYGSNAVGAGPELQSGPTHMSTAPGHSGPVGPHLPSGPSTGVPVGGPPLGGGKVPTAPPKLPNGPVSNPRTTLGPRGAIPAKTTPGLPGRGTGGVNGRSGPMTSTQARSAGRGGKGTPNGARNRWAGRGLQKSQMEPVNRVGQPRKAGEVLGSRSTKSSKADAGKAPARKVQSAVVRGGNKTKKNPNGKKSPVDNTKRGYSSRVINPRDRLAEARGHSRTPLVGKKLNTTVRPEPIGKRPEPETARTKIRAEIDAIRAERRRQRESDGLSRPVINNGVSHPAQLDQAIPTPREAVKTPEAVWQPQAAVVPNVIGKRHWNPDLVDHDPGPVANAQLQARRAFEAELDARVAAIDPGPTAFDPKRRQPDTTTWPGA